MPTRAAEAATCSAVVECQFWNASEDAWSTAGCTTTLAPDGTVGCVCNHLTEFIAVEFPTSTDDLMVALLASVGMNSLSTRAIECALNPSRSWRTVLAVLIGLASFAIEGAGIGLFKRFGTTVSPLTPEESSVLVTSGIYRFTRNPMYVGMVGILIAVAVALGDAVPLLVGPTLYVLIVTRLQIIPEELMLKDIFGDEYVAYCRQTRRWI